MLTVVTGLEKKSFSNLMAQITQPIGYGVTTGLKCNQTQVLAGYGISGQDNGTQNLSTFPVSLTTPLNTDVSFGDGSNPAVWLQASTFGAIKFPVPLRTQIDYGVAGALVSTSIADSDGNCPMMNGSGQPNVTYSMIGHFHTFVTQDTTVPLKLWIMNSQPTDATQLPIHIGGGVCDLRTSGTPDYSQDCPDQNFKRMNLTGCAGSSTCGPIATNNGIMELQYFYGINGPQHITHRVKLSNATTQTGLLIADANPLNIIIFDQNSTAKEKLNFNNPNSGGPQTPTLIPTPSPTPFFSLIPSNTLDTTYLNVQSHGGNSNGFRFGSSDQSSSGFNLNWDNAYGAVSYTVFKSTDGGSTFTQSLTTTSGTTAALTSGNYSAGNLNYYQVKATDSFGTTTVSASMALYPLNTGLPTATTGPSSGSLSVSSFMTTGATNYKFESSNFSPAGPWSSPQFTNSTSTFIYSGLTPSTSYYVRVTATNNQHGFVQYNTTTAAVSAP